MSLLNDLTALTTARKPGGGVTCRIKTILDSMNPDEAKALQHLIDVSDVYGTSIARTLTGHGYQINGSQVQHHRRRLRGAGCSCELPEVSA